MSDFKSSKPDDSVSLLDIVLTLKNWKWTIFACILFSAVIGLLYAVFTTPLYRASVTLNAVAEEGAKLSGAASQLGGVAALAGIDIGGGGTNKEEYVAILKSRELGKQFIERLNLKPHLFPKRWDDEAGQWKRKGGKKTGFAASVSRTLARLSGDEGWREEITAAPSDWEAYKKFNEEIRRIGEDNKTGIITVSFEYRNPKRVAEWANAYVALANEDIRQRTVDETSRALSYLTERAEQTVVAGIRETIYGLVEAQLEKIMLANVRQEYAFRVIDEATVPERKATPQRGLTVIVSVIVGFVLGLFISLILEAAKSSKLSKRDDALSEHRKAPV